MTSKKRKGEDPEQNTRTRPGNSNAGMGGGMGGLVGGSDKAPGNISGSSKAPEYWAGYRQHAYELLESGGVVSSRLGLEILYLLPAEFIEFYQALFHTALRVDDGSVMHGRSGGLEKAKGSPGMVLGSEIGAQAKGGGKKYKNTPMAIGNEDALRIKTMVDSRLMELIGEARDMASRIRDARTSASTSENAAGTPNTAAVNKAALQCQGYHRTWVADGTGNGSGNGSGNGMPPRCGKYLRAGWKYCPSCGTRVGG